MISVMIISVMNDGQWLAVMIFFYGKTIFSNKQSIVLTWKKCRLSSGSTYYYYW